MVIESSDTRGAIAITHLTKCYGSIRALDDVTLKVPSGAVFGFLGPNGAGKTTAIKILMGFIKPTSGFAVVLGSDAWRQGVDARRDLGFLVQPDNLFHDMSGNAHLDYADQLSGRTPVLRNRLLEALELSSSDLRRRLGSYSKGMRQKLALVAAIQHDPALLILDEPSDGLDPLIQHNFEEVIRDLNRCGTTVFMSSHDLAEVERTCEFVAVVREGRMVAEETVAGLKRMHRRRAQITFRSEPPAMFDSVQGSTVIERDNRGITLLIEGDINPLLRLVSEHNIEDFTLSPPGLDDIFMGFYRQESPDDASNQELPAADSQAVSHR